MHILSDSSTQAFINRVKKGSNNLGITVSDHQATLMSRHAEVLMVWNKKINLTAIKDPLFIAEKHFIDSIAAASFIENETCLVDLGSGGGFPGIPIKIMRPDLKMVLVDASRKKINFLKHCIRTLGLENIEAIHSRVEDLHANKDYQNNYDAVISRAFTQLSNFIALAAPLINKKGRLYAMKGKHVNEEITPDMKKKFDLKTDHYQLPFEKSDRYMIRLSPLML